MARNVLVVVMVDLDSRTVSGLVKERTRPGDVIEVVVPAQPSRLEWLVSDEDRAREQAAQQGRKLAAKLDQEDEGPDAEVADPDPVQAIEDALARFPADEIIVVTRPDDDADWLEKRAFDPDLGEFDASVTHLLLPEEHGGRNDESRDWALLLSTSLAPGRRLGADLCMKTSCDPATARTRSKKRFPSGFRR